LGISGDTQTDDTAGLTNTAKEALQVVGVANIREFYDPVKGFRFET
jgi:hypothetical protein